MAKATRYQFSTVPGFFEHDDKPEGPDFRAATKPSLGLRAVDYEASDDKFVLGPDHVQNPQWTRFLHHLHQLNERDEEVQYKLFFVIRHGQGFHNLKSAQVGKPTWPSDWAHKDGDGVLTWFDSDITDKGKQQASVLAAFLKTSAIRESMPIPRHRYTSPLARTLETTKLAFDGLENVSSPTSRTIVKENLREKLRKFTADRRRTRGWIHEQYPDYEIEDDELWKCDIRETLEEHVLRIEALLTYIFESDPEHIISLTAHSGTMRALYTAIGHSVVWPGTGVMVPVLVKAQAQK